MIVRQLPCVHARIGQAMPQGLVQLHRSSLRMIQVGT